MEEKLRFVFEYERGVWARWAKGWANHVRALPEFRNRAGNRSNDPRKRARSGCMRIQSSLRDWRVRPAQRML